MIPSCDVKNGRVKCILLFKSKKSQRNFIKYSEAGDIKAIRKMKKLKQVTVLSYD